MAIFCKSRANDWATFDALCTSIEAPLYSYALRLLGNASEAEEIAQEALVRLFHALHSKQLKQAPRAYAFSIAHNLVMDFHRAQHPGRTLSAPEQIVRLQPKPPASPAAAAEQSLLRNELNKALDDLPADQRAALMLREFGEMRYDEIAETLGVPLAQIRIRIYRARKKLALLLDRDGQYIGKSHHGT